LQDIQSVLWCTHKHAQSEQMRLHGWEAGACARTCRHASTMDWLGAHDIVRMVMSMS